MRTNLYNTYVLIALLLCCSCSGGGTLGSSSSGGVTIKGQARFRDSNVPLANSQMDVREANTNTQLVASETDSNGEFNMSLPKSGDPITIKLDTAKNSILIDADLLRLDQLRVLILESESRTDIGSYLGVELQTGQNCFVRSDERNSRPQIILTTEGEECDVRLRAIFGGSPNSTQAKVSLCGETLAVLSSDSEMSVPIRNTTMDCESKVLSVAYDSHVIEYQIN